MDEQQAAQVPICGISKRGRELLQNAGIKTLGDIFPGFAPSSFMAKFSSFSQGDLFSLAAALRSNFGKEVIIRRGWSKTAIRSVTKTPYRSGSFFPGTDQGVINRFINKATNGKHYKKPRQKGLL